MEKRYPRGEKGDILYIKGVMDRNAKFLLKTRLLKEYSKMVFTLRKGIKSTKD